MLRAVPSLCALVLLLAGCGDDDGSDAVSDSSTTTTTTTSTTSGDDSTTTGNDGAGGDDLPGQPIEIYPYDGATLAVVGVAADDLLNVRSGPGTRFDVEFTLDPLHAGATATGNNRQLAGGAVWAEIRDDGRAGWANTAFLLQPGQVTDETARLYPNPSDRPRAETMVQLARVAAGDVGSDEPRPTVTIVDGPTVGDLGEVTVDVIGLGDDALGGYRLHLFAEPGPGGESFTLRTVESIALCSRGVSNDGLCL